MKNIGKYLLLYNFVCIMAILIDYAWYCREVTWFGITSNQYNFLDVIDAPFYFLGTFYYFYYRKKLTDLQRISFYTCFLYLFVKIIYNFDFTTFIIVNLLIISIPLWFWLSKKINKEWIRNLREE